jgi:signal peptidase I
MTEPATAPVATGTPSTDTSSSDTEAYSTPVLVAGIVGRTWLWFVAGCVIITLVPLLIGWHSYVIQSGSMEPRLQVGDVVIASPNPSADDLLGRVAVFTDPDNGKTKTHRVTAINADGTLQTKGDNNPTADPQPLPEANVQGMARLLVRWVGLPLMWFADGQWGWLALLATSLLLAGAAVARDHEDDDPIDPDDDGPSGDLVPLPTASAGTSATTIAASTPVDPGLSRVRHAVVGGLATAPTAALALLTGRRWVTRTAYAAVLACAVVLPTAGAAFAATTRNPANTWAAGSWSLTSTINDMSPWLYWKLDETSGTVAADSSGNGRTGSYNPNGNASNFTRGVVGANPSDTPNRAVTLRSTNACINTASTTTMNAPASLTSIVWFKTTTTNGGKLVGFEMPRTGVAIPGGGGTYDRHLYMDGSGRVWYGVYNGGYYTISSAAGLNDGQWHMAAASLGSTGMRLYIDGVLVDTDANTVGESTTGWFRAGCGNLGGWGGSWTGPNNPTTSTGTTQNRPFAGSLDEIAIWQSALTATQIQQIYAAR